MKVHIIGADISKQWIDLVIHGLGVHLKIANNLSGFQKSVKWITQQNMDCSEIFIVMEHTGMYTFRFEQFLHHQNILFTKVSALAIKRSLGLVRGKNDKIDAGRIAQYGFEKKDRLTPEPKISKALQRLQLLYCSRERAVRLRASAITAINEMQQCMELAADDFLVTSEQNTIKSLSEQIKGLEKEIEQIIETEESLRNNYKLLISVKGVGKIVAVAMIIKTSNFLRFKNPRKFACYCGVAPFEHSSGSSIRGRTRVSHLADKEMKTLLEMAARTAIQHDKELNNIINEELASGNPKEMQ